MAIFARVQEAIDLGDGLVPSAGEKDVFMVKYSLQGVQTSLEPEAVRVDRLILSAAYPNPFRHKTQFTIQLAQPHFVQVSAYDLLGRQVALVYRGWVGAPAPKPFQWQTAALPAGTYLVRAQAGPFVTSRLVTLVR